MIKHHSLPKHIQISEMLIREIMSGRIPDGARLPSERQMAKEQGVAIGTLRKALADMQQKGVLERIQGSGNYVRAKNDIGSVYSFFRLELKEGGGLPTAEVLSAEKHNKPPGAPYFGDSAQAHRIRRLRYLSARLVALEEIWLDTRFANTVTAASLVDSLYYYYKQDLGLIITRIEDQVSVNDVPSWSPERFPVAPGLPAGYIERTGWDQHNAPAEFSRTWFDPATARYTMRLR